MILDFQLSKENLNPKLRLSGDAMEKLESGNVLHLFYNRPLTPREKSVSKMVFAGLRNREIALELNMAESTVRQNLTSIYRKLGVRSRYEMTRLFFHEPNRFK